MARCAGSEGMNKWVGRVGRRRAEGERKQRWPTDGEMEGTKESRQSAGPYLRFDM